MQTRSPLLFRRSIHLISAAIALGLTSTSQAQTPKIGLVVVAHGADSVWNARVRETVAQVKWPAGPVSVAFLMGPEAMTSSWNVATDELQKKGVDGIVAVPFMVSTFGSHVRQIQFYAGELKEMPKELEGMDHGHGAPTPLKVPVKVTTALDDARELGEVLSSRWRDLPARDHKRALMLVAHGPDAKDDAARWEANIMVAAKALSAQVAPMPVRVSLLRDDAPAPVRAQAVQAMRDTISMLAKRSNDSVTVMPVLISSGSINTVVIPRDLAGLPISYAGIALAPHPALARWLERIGGAARIELEHAMMR